MVDTQRAEGVYSAGGSNPINWCLGNRKPMLLRGAGRDKQPHEGTGSATAEGNWINTQQGPMGQNS